MISDSHSRVTGDPSLLGYYTMLTDKQLLMFKGLLCLQTEETIYYTSWCNISKDLSVQLNLYFAHTLQQAKHKHFYKLCVLVHIFFHYSAFDITAIKL
jgi:hypothetical protein